MEFINLIKDNYKTNKRGYVKIWLLLFIPIIFCSIQTIKLNNWNGDIELVEDTIEGKYDFEVLEHRIPDGMDIEEYFPVYVGGLFETTFLFVILSAVIISSVVILSSRNNKDFKYKKLYIVLSLLLYCAILYAILLWCSKVTILIDYGSAISRERIASHSLSLYCIFYFVCIGIYLGICAIFYSIISWFRHKGYTLFMILSILILLPIWVFLSYCFLVSLLWSML